MRWKAFLFFLFYLSKAMALSCPTGYIVVEEPNVIIADTCPVGVTFVGSANACDAEKSSVCWLIEQVRALCNTGISNIKTSSGLNVPLYSERGTTPSLCVNYNNTTCYADLESGNVSGAINVKYNGVVYHTVD